MSEIKLLPCPFCGGEAVTHVSNGVSVICTMCGAHSKTLVDSYSQGKPTGRAVDKVVKAWNNRKPVEDVLNDINAEIDSSDKYIMEYDDSIEQKVFNSGMRKILKIVKEGLM